MLGKLLRGWNQRAGRRTAHTAEEKQRAALASLLSYPPPRRGLPILTADELLAVHDAKIRAVAYSSGLSWDEFDDVVLPVYRRAAEYLHLLPASQSHHHDGVGGLLSHSIEVSYHAVRAAGGVIFTIGKTPAERRKLELRWKVAAAVTGLLHDIGKPVTDVQVEGPSGERWSPFLHSLIEWADEAGIDRYFVRWREGRHRQHETMGSSLLGDVITPRFKAWLTESGTEVYRAIIEAVGNPANKEVLHELMVNADSASVEIDMKKRTLLESPQQVGIKFERHILDAMQRLLQGGEWAINQPGSRIWHGEQGTFVAWEGAASDIILKLQDENIPGLPRGAEALADLMLESEKAVSRVDRQHGYEDRYWMIAPEALKRKNNTYPWFKCIKLSSFRLLVDEEPEHAELHIQGMDAVEHEGDHPAPENGDGTDAAPQEGKDSAEADKDSETAEEGEKPAGENPLDSGPATRESDHTQVGTDQMQAMPRDKGDEQQQEADPAAPSPEPDPEFAKRAAALGLPDTTQLKPAHRNRAHPEGVEPSPAKEGGPAKPPVNTTVGTNQQDKSKSGKQGEEPKPESQEQALKTIEAQPDFGPALAKMIRAVNSGELECDSLFRTVNGAFHIVYPNPVRPFIQPAKLASGLEGVGWLIPDPLNPSRKAQHFPDGKKGLVLERVNADLVQRALAERPKSREQTPTPTIAQSKQAGEVSPAEPVELAKRIRLLMARKDQRLYNRLPGFEEKGDKIYFRRIGIQMLVVELGTTTRAFQDAMGAVDFIEMTDGDKIVVNLKDV